MFESQSTLSCHSHDMAASCELATPSVRGTTQQLHCTEMLPWLHVWRFPVSRGGPSLNALRGDNEHALQHMCVEVGTAQLGRHSTDSSWGGADLLTGVVPREALGRLGVPEPGSELAGASLGSRAGSPCSAARATAARSSSMGSVKSFGGPCSRAYTGSSLLSMHVQRIALSAPQTQKH